jgi:hypothetical protein
MGVAEVRRGRGASTSRIGAARLIPGSGETV